MTIITIITIMRGTSGSDSRLQQTAPTTGSDNRLRQSAPSDGCGNRLRQPAPTAGAHRAHPENGIPTPNGGPIPRPENGRKTQRQKGEPRQLGFTLLALSFAPVFRARNWPPPADPPDEQEKDPGDKPKLQITMQPCQPP